MSDLLELAEMEADDEELVPEILPSSARLALTGPVSELIELFSRAAAVTPTKEEIPGTGSALLEAFAPSKHSVSHARITATDGEQTLSVINDSVSVSMEGAVLVPPKKILDILRIAPSQKARIKVLGSDLVLLSGQAQWTVKLPPGDTLPPLRDVGDLQTQEMGRRSLLHALKRVQRAVSTTTARQALMQAHIAEGRIIASDGGRVHAADMQDWPMDLSLSIPVKVIGHLMTLLEASEDDWIEVAGDEFRLLFRIGENSIVVQRTMVMFPAERMETLLRNAAITNHGSIVVNERELLEIIKRVRVNADPDYMALFLSVSPGRETPDGERTWNLVVRAIDRAGNSAQEALACQWHGSGKPPREMCVNHRFFSDLLTSHGVGDGDVVLRIGDDTKTQRYPILIEDVAEEFTGLVSQMRSEFLK